jgi:hypothetical protein
VAVVICVRENVLTLLCREVQQTDSSGSDNGSPEDVGDGR